jgi:hypothetical protein
MRPEFLAGRRKIWRTTTFAVECANAPAMPARESDRQMGFARWLGHRFRQNVALIAPAVIGALLLSAVATAWHDCHGHDHDHSDCPICWLAKAPICTSDDSPPPAPPETWLELIVQPTARPTCRPLLTFAARAPPADLL